MSNETNAKAMPIRLNSGNVGLGLWIPAAEAREFLEAVEGMAEHCKIWELRDKARALLATLPKEESDEG